jgi:rod shape-determining protein MreC
LTNGLAIITTDGLVGRILKTSDNYSHILLLNDFNSRIPVYTDTSREKAIMVGNHNSYPTLKYLNAKHKIQNNEIVYSAGDGIMYPADIPIGVTTINAQNEITVVPFVELNNLQFVKVIL